MYNSGEVIRLFYKIKDGIDFGYDSQFTPAASPRHYPHTHDYSELYFHIQGDCSYMVEDGIYPMEYGSIVITRPGELHCVRIDKSCQHERCFFMLKEHAFDFLGTNAPWHCFRERPFGQNNVINLPKEMMNASCARIRHMMALYKEHSPDCRAIALAEFLMLLSEINTLYREAAGHGMSPKQNSLVNSALRYINRNLRTMSSVDELAAELYVSREHLSRCFTAQVGVSPGKYITMKRIEYAKTLLGQGLELDEVCSECGWHDYSYFIYVFRRETGMTPLKYRSGTGTKPIPADPK